jgi:hypothetical protein
MALLHASSRVHEYQRLDDTGGCRKSVARAMQREPVSICCLLLTRCLTRHEDLHADLLVGCTSATGGKA